MSKIVGAQRSLQRFYLYGREDAEEDFEPEDVPDLDELATKILDGVGDRGSDLRAMLRGPIDKLLEIDEFDGDEKSWREEYAEELEGVDAAKARELWRAGYIDEAMLDLEAVVVDRMEELLDLAEYEEETIKASSSPQEDYSAWADDGRDDASDAWDDGEMKERIAQILDEVNKSGWSTDVERVQAIKQESAAAAEAYQEDAEEDGAKDEWMKLNAEDARAYGLNPEIAYAKHWRPAFVARIGELIEERVTDHFEAVGRRARRRAAR